MKTKVNLDVRKLDYACELMRAVAHPLRLRILEFIDQNDNVNVNKIYDALRIEQSVTSQHLSILRSAGVIETSKTGRYVHCTIIYDVIERVERAVKRFHANASTKAEKKIKA